MLDLEPDFLCWRKCARLQLAVARLSALKWDHQHAAVDKHKLKATKRDLKARNVANYKQMKL